MAEHKEGPATFADMYWVKGKNVFAHPTGADVEMTTGGTFEWAIADTSGSIVKTVSARGGGWTSIDFGSLGLYKSYSIGFRNTSGGSRTMKEVVIRYG